jgi:hypothetical protein
VYFTDISQSGADLICTLCPKTCVANECRIRIKNSDCNDLFIKIMGERESINIDNLI